MNPLPNRPLLTNPNLPLQLPNVPQFEMPYNGRPRKAMPDVGKEYSMLNGMGLMSGPSTAPAAPQTNPLDRPGLAGPGVLGQQAGQPQSGLGQQVQPQQPQQLQPQQFPGEGKDREEPEQPLSDEGDWKERFRLSQEGSEQARHQLNNTITGAGAWERRAREEDEDGKDEDGEVDDDDASVMSDGESTKVWKAKRTLRKSVSVSAS